MSLQPFKDEELNYLKFASIVLNEFPRALRQTFRSMWDNTFGHLSGFQLWDDSIAVRSLFLGAERGKTKVPTNLSYEEWDCTALFKATIYARSFALPDSAGHHKTLNDLYVTPRKLAHGSFHVSVMSPGGNDAETVALAIDQLRLLRNSLCHSTSSEIVKATFDRYVQYAKDSFKSLGVKTDPIDVIGGLTESDFPTKEVLKLEQAMQEERRAYITFLEGVSSDIDELRELVSAMKVTNASKEDISRLEQKINDLKEASAQDKPGLRPSLPKLCLDPMVPHFTGRETECEEITGLVTSESIRIVSIWGSPGFGKTSVAIAVGHHLHSQGLPVYYLSIRGLQSTTDLASKLHSLFRRPVASEQQNQPDPSIDPSIGDELSHLFSELSEPFTIILDNADELLSGGPKAKEDFTHFLANILRRNEKLTFVITTRESLEFMNVQFQVHQGVRISPLDEPSSQNLVNELLPNLTVSDCKRVSKICGHVPLAMKLLCSFVSEDGAELSQVLDDFEGSLEMHNIVEMLDNPDDPSNLRLKLLFDSSFQRLSDKKKEALVSLCVLPESFDLTVAAAVLGAPQISVAKKVLHSLRRKSLLESGSKPETFLMHQLILSFANQRGENEMKEVLLKSKARLCAFYVSRFENLNEQFLTGHSMSAFIDFYKDEQNITRSLIEGSADSKTTKDVIEVLVNADIFLYSLYRRKRTTFCKIYDSASKAAKMFENKNLYRRLLVSKSLYRIFSGTRSGSMRLLSCTRQVEESYYPVSDSDRGKRLCYNGIRQLTNGKTEDGAQCLEDAVSLMNSSPGERILRLTVFQILVIYYRVMKNSSKTSLFYRKALQECKELGDAQLLVTPEGTGKELPGTAKEDLSQRNPAAPNNQPLKYEIISIIKAATKQFCDDDTKRSLKDAALNVAEEIKTPTLQSSLGLYNFQTNVMTSLRHLREFEVAAELSASRISFHETTLEKRKSSKEKNTGHEENLTSPTLNHDEELAKNYSEHASLHYSMQNYVEAQKYEQRALNIRIGVFGNEHQRTADSYHSLGETQHAQGDLSSALQYKQRALDIRRKLCGEEHSSTADSYHSLGLTQHALGDFSSAIQSAQCALDIRRELFGEEHSSTADSYFLLWITQHKLADFSSAVQSAHCALDITRKLFGEEHSRTSDSYLSLGETQHALGDFSSALHSKQRALDIRRKQCGEEHSNTADCYLSLGATQHALGDFSSALHSKQRALDIRRNLCGEEHSNTADSYLSLGETQHALGDFSSALQSRQRALDIRRKRVGEKHSNTADSYLALGETQHALGEFSSAFHSKQRALDIRRKLFGEEHSNTADSYLSLGATQHALANFSCALHYKQRALDIRRKLCGEEHSNTADSYLSLGETQHALANFSCALHSKQRALDIRRKLFGEEHFNTAESYLALGEAQHALGDFSLALHSRQRALDIRRKLFGEEHSNTADSYLSLGETQNALGDFSLALYSKERALDIRRKLFGEEHSNTADSYHSLGETRHKQGDFSLALQCKQRALDIRLKLFGEEHSSIAESNQSLGATQHKLGDFSSALESKQRALDIARKLFGEEHPSTAESYLSRGITQHQLGEFSSALQSKQCALDIGRKLFGEEHSSTADSYQSLGVTQHKLGDLSSALQSKQRALDIRRELFGEEHLCTSDSYLSLGVTQYELGDFLSDRQSTQRALDIRHKLFGQNCFSSAVCYYSLGKTQHNLGDFSSALQSKQRALEIRLEFLGKTLPSTADNYHSLGITQYELGDFSSARWSAQRAFDARLKTFGEKHPSTADSLRLLQMSQNAVDSLLKS